VVLCRKREIMGELKLTVNKDKTRNCKMPEGEIDSLVFERMYSSRTEDYALGSRTLRLRFNEWMRPKSARNTC